MRGKNIFENKKIRNVVGEIADTALILWQRGWAERNAGNISVNITSLVSDQEQAFFNKAGSKSIGNKKYLKPGIKGQVFLLTCAGTRMREIAKSPEEYLCLIKITGQGIIRYLVNHGTNQNRRLPTSELPTHLAIHRMLLSERPEFKAIIHTHALEMIALTQIKEYKSEKKLNRLLWGMHPETMSFVPEGIGYIPYTLPGTREIATASVNGLKKHNVIVWEKHGILAIGKSVTEAFDLIDIMAKSARIFFTCHNAGFEPEGLTPSQLKTIKQYYSL